ncbi:MAG: glycosyltransferase [Bacteroidales bacterium]|nr:glycosyltransferase [Bacteroidales bacterium]
MKPRIFINMHYMELGGAERALLGLLYAIDTERVDVDLFINQHTGPFMSLIPDKINLLPEIPRYSAIERPLMDILREGHLMIFLARLWGTARHGLYMKIHRIKNDGTGSQFIFDSVSRLLPSLHYLGEYDLAISFLDPPHIVQDKVLAKKKIEWIHTDFSGKVFSYDPRVTFRRWAANDGIVSISDDVTRSFVSAFPSLAGKIIKIENIIPASLVKSQAATGEPAEYSEMGRDIFRICSVGRLCYQKNFDNVPAIASILKTRGLKFKWWIVGPGDVESYNALAERYGVADCVVFLGPRENPYPYMLHCDLYVQPSRLEGKAITVQEAQMLGRAVLITNFPTSGSQLKDGEDGVVCGMDNASIAQAIASLACDCGKRKRLGENAEKMHLGNTEEVEKIYDLI